MPISPDHDRNVAVAWTQWLLRDDDSPVTLGDAAMNGLAAGAVCGAAVDTLAALLRRARLTTSTSATFTWARRGAVVGCSVTMMSFAVLQLRASAPRQLLATQKEDALMSDPWVGQQQGRPVS